MNLYPAIEILRECANSHGDNCKICEAQNTIINHIEKLNEPKDESFKIVIGQNVPMSVINDSGSLINVIGAIRDVHLLVSSLCSHTNISPIHYARAIGELCLAMNGNGRAENIANLYAKYIATKYGDWCGGETNLQGIGQEIYRVARHYHDNPNELVVST